MAVASPVTLAGGLMERVEATVALLEARGYALGTGDLGRVCVGGRLSATEIEVAVASSPRLRLASGLVVRAAGRLDAGAVAGRAAGHAQGAGAARETAVRFVERWILPLPFLVSVSVAGSLASGGFAAADDIDLNLVVEDGCRHLAYVAVNAAAFGHAFRRRRKPVDRHSRRPLAPRLVSVNLLLERSECFPLARTDIQMAYELLVSQPLHGAAFLARVVDENPALGRHFPQLAACPRSPERMPRRLPRWLLPPALDPAARAIGHAAWRWMQWTRRGDPEALAHVEFIRACMRPYALFDR